MTTIAIDGPGGAGKSTLARLVAACLGLEHLDTGAMYRAVTLLALRAGVDAGDEVALTSLAREMELDVSDQVLLGGEDVTSAIRAEEVDAAVSAVAAVRGVRAELVARQRAWVHDGGGVVEGRDIGTVVLPDADLKIYLTAQEDERARRRAAESATEDSRGSVERVLATIGRRDALDRTRAESPLVAAADAVHLDSTGRAPEEIADLVVALLGSAV